MRIVVFSDTHHNTSLFQKHVQQAMDDGKIDAFIHCGDGVRDVETVEQKLMKHNQNIRIYAVRGNCDLGVLNYPATDIADFCGVRSLITHGHNDHVKHGLDKLVHAAAKLDARLVFFGHTHQPTIKKKHGILLVNPGSLLSLSASNTAYLEIQIDANQNIRENFINLC